MQIFVCISFHFHRLFYMTFETSYLSSDSFWQSTIWKDILTSSHQAHSCSQVDISKWSILLEIRSVGMGFFAGFVTGSTFDELSEKDFQKIIRIACQKKCIFLQIEPIDWNISFPGKIPYRHFLEPYTRLIDLKKSESEIFSEMHEKWRYNIRLAEKRWVKTQWVEPTSENRDIWMKLLSETTSRDGFSQNSSTYYKIFLERLQSQNAGWLLFASFEWQVIAAGIFVFFGKQAIYYYGASTSEKDLRKHMAPYLLQWEAIQEGKRRSCAVYDFLGIAAPWDKKSHLRWVTEFKEKFWGNIIKLPEKKLFPLSWKYGLFLMIRKIKFREYFL